MLERPLTRFNWFFFFVVILLNVFGLINLYSATSSFEGQVSTNYFKAQALWNGIGIFLLFFIVPIHYKHLKSLSFLIYVGGCVFLVLVLIIGKKVHGNQSWIVLGPVSLQPTELAKIGLIFGLSKYLADIKDTDSFSFKTLLPSLMYLMVPFILVSLQGDLGSSLFYIFIYGTMVLIHGIRIRLLALASGVLMGIVVIAYLFVLSPYQKDRVRNFLNPELDRKGSGYHLVQSKIAVGSGQWLGKGYLKGQAHKLKFIPERHTDFIFSVLAEEWGFVGCFLVLSLFFLFFYLGMDIAAHANDRYSFFMSVGILSLFFWHIIVNLWGILGLMPLTGVPLTFFSYGGSSVITNWIGIGLLLNISYRRFIFT